MTHFKKGLLGLILVLAGITLFVLVVPTVETGQLEQKDYWWAMLITASTCLGFGLLMISLFRAE